MKTTLNSLLFLLLILPSFLIAQNQVSGTVTEESSFPMPGVNVIIKGSSQGTATDFDGKYQLDVNKGDVIVFSYVGYLTQEVTYDGQTTLNVTLTEDASQLDEVVIIGYGSVKKEDATGSVSLVTDEDFNKGNIVSTDQLINGKVAGVRITNAGGQPDSDPNIRIRGGGSLSSNNSPLIVIDGVPLSNINPAGVSNPLSLVNPNDVESFSILKDASATAIYGARASNGVIIITTKKGTSGKPQFNFSTDISVNSAGDGIDMMDSNTYVRFIQEYHPDLVDKLGVPVGSVQTNEQISQIINTPSGQRAIYDTDWRDNVLRTAFTSNTNFSARAHLFDALPFRGSISYTNAEGVVKTDDYERVTASINLSPKFLDDDLKVTLNAKATYADKNSVDAGGALGGSLVFDPTKPVYNNATDNRFGGYYFNTNQDGNRLILDGQWNPLALLEQRERPERATRFLGNLELDYSFNFIPGLRAVVNLGLDASKSKIVETFSDNAAATYQFDVNDNYLFNPGENYAENQHITNTTMDAFLQYTKSYDNIFIRKFDIQAGYSYQNFKNDGTKREYRYHADDQNTTDDDGLVGQRELIYDPANPNNRYYNEYNLQSFFGRANLDLLNKYLFTFSLRADASSLFVIDDVWDSNVWGFFPAAAFAWKVNSEEFMQNVNFVNELKIRIGWGRTGQNDISQIVGYYPTTALFTPGSPSSQYLPGAGLYSALPYNSDLTWEKTTTYNLGVDFSFFKNNFVSGSFDIYKRYTKDLLATVVIPPGQGFSDTFIKNVGEIEGKGFELNLILNPIQNDDLSVSLNSNLSYTYNEITDIGGQADINRSGSLRGTGLFLMSDVPGQQAQSAYVFKQVYDNNGNVIPGAFVDLNGDNVINNEDRYHIQMAPNWTYGFGLDIAYKNWDFSSGFIGQVGGNIYNYNKMNFGFTDAVIPANNNSITNALNFYNGSADPAFETVNGNIQLSDYFIEDATFLRCNNIVLGYTFDNMIKNGNVRMYGAVSNPFIITDYSGIDPQNFGGIDRDFYPRPTTFTLGVNFDF